MIRKLPIIASPAGPGMIARAAAGSFAPSVRGDFADAVSRAVAAPRASAADSGVSAFYLILKAVSGMSGRTEVILPAYTAGSLVVAVRKAGLKPVLCDTTSGGFNMDADGIKRLITRDTLAVNCVHSFGIPMKGIERLRGEIPDEVFIIEDCAQAMGSRLASGPVGSFGDAAFFSFGRGKNFPLCGGGCMIAGNGALAAALEGATALPGGQTAFSLLCDIFNAAAFSLAKSPIIYGALFSLISRFKETSPAADIDPAGMPAFASSLGIKLLPDIDRLFFARSENGKAIISALRGIPGITLPEIPDGSVCVFNRMPVLLKDAKTRESVEAALWNGGIESSRMYFKPLHHMFDMGYAADALPNSIDLASRLLALPVHQGVGEGDIRAMSDIIKRNA